MTTPRCALVVLISGRGSNLKAILDAIAGGRLNAEVRAVVSNDPAATGLRLAQEKHIAAHALNHRDFSSREAFDDRLMETIDRYQPNLVVLAGFMRILGKAFIRHYAGRLINIHPSLLPAFPGLNTHARAIETGVKEHGARVHFVTDEVDGGPIVLQAKVKVGANDTPQTLADRVLAEEHRIYPIALQWFSEGRLKIGDNHVTLDGRVRSKEELVR
jgi:phosphoribosylglycinamide formyltransferase-1